MQDARVPEGEKADALPASDATAAGSGFTIPERDLAAEVDVLIGTDDALVAGKPIEGGAGGAVFPGATVPFGMVQWSPDTDRADPPGYRHADTRIRGFSLTHLSGAGCKALGDFPFLPTATALEGGESVSEAWRHEDEHASPGSYAVKLTSGIETELTATTRTGMARIKYPGGSTGRLLVSSRGLMRTIDGSVDQVDNRLVTGRRTSGGFCGTAPSTYTVYFAARFDRRITKATRWSGLPRDLADTNHNRERSEAGANTGLELELELGADRIVHVRVGLSFTSAANALANLDAENADGSFDDVRARARAAWNEMLNRLRVDGGTADERRSFYSALYRSLLHPNVVSDASGEYAGFDKQVHRVSGRLQYANFSSWDTYRSWVQLMAVLAPHETGDMAASLVAAGQQCGILPLWPLVNDETRIMVGDPSAVWLANAHAFGATGFDARAALALMLKSATDPAAKCNGQTVRQDLGSYQTRGYCAVDPPPELLRQDTPPERAWGPASTTLEQAIADFAVGQLAQSLGDAATASKLVARSRNWKNTFDAKAVDPNLASHVGYVRARMTSGAWKTPFDPSVYKPDEMVEGNAAQYTFMIPHDVPGLVAALGGKPPALERLNDVFVDLNAGHSRPYFYMGNEPQFGVPWLYPWLGEAWRTQELVRRIAKTVFAPSPSGLPGNDDLGALSSWYVWAAIGLYPAAPGVGGFVVASPMFPRTELRLGGGVLAIVGQGAGEANVYVQRLELDGSPIERAWIPLSDLARARSLVFTLGATANRGWGVTPPPAFFAD